MKSEKILYFIGMLFQKWKNKHLQWKKHECKNILLTKWDEIGDVVTALHVFELLKSSHPKAHITVLCKPFVNELLSQNPYIDKLVNDVNLIDFKEKPFDTVIELRGTFRSFKKILRYPPKVYLCRGAIRFQQRGNQKHETITNFKIVEPLLSTESHELKPTVYLSTEAVKEAQEFKNQVKEPFVLMHILARKELRQWPQERFAEIAQYLDHRHGLKTALVGAPSEESRLIKMSENFPKGTTVYCSQNGLLGFAALCHHAKFFIGNESGPMQIAATIPELPLIALYGPGVPHVFYPLDSNKKILHHILDCNPCDQINCVQPEKPCINLIEVAHVKAMIDELLM